MTVVREAAVNVKVIDQASAQLQRIHALLDSLPKSVNVAVNATSQYNAAQRTLGDTFGVTNRAITQSETAIKRMDKSTEKVASTTKKATDEAKRFSNVNQDLVNKLRITASSLDALQMYRFGNTAYSASFFAQSLGKLGIAATDTGMMFSILSGYVGKFRDITAGAIGATEASAATLPLVGARVAGLVRMGAVAVGATSVAMTASVLGLTLVMAAGFPVAVHWQTQMANIAKTTGMSGAALEELSNSLLTVASSSGVASTDIAQIAVVAGQVGIEGTENITAFTEAVSDAAIAFDLTGVAAATFIAKLSNIYNIDPKEVNHMTSAITYLGNTTAASEAEIMDFMLTIGNTMEMMGASADEAAAYGTTLISLGIDASRAGTELNSAMMFLMRPANLGKLARLGGMSKKEMMTGDFDQNLLKVIKGIAKIEDPIKRNEVLVERFGFIGAKSMRSLVENVDDLEKNLNEVKTAFKDGTAAGEEARRKRETFGAEWTNTINLLKQIFATMGEPLVPFATVLLRIFNQLLRVLVVVAQAISIAVTPFVILFNVINKIFNLLSKIDFLPNLMRTMGGQIAQAHNPSIAGAIAPAPLAGFVPKSHQEGLGYVPYDNYIAKLHKGEQILTAVQARNLAHGSKNYYAADQMLRDVLSGTGTMYNVNDVLKGTATGAGPMGGTPADQAMISFFTKSLEKSETTVKQTAELSWFSRIIAKFSEIAAMILRWIYDLLKIIDKALANIPTKMINALMELPKALLHGIAAVAQLIITAIVHAMNWIYNAIAIAASKLTFGLSEDKLPILDLKKSNEDADKEIQKNFGKLHDDIRGLSWKNITSWLFGKQQTPAGPSNPFAVNSSVAAQAYKMQMAQTTVDQINASKNNFPYVNIDKVNVVPNQVFGNNQVNTGNTAVNNMIANMNKFDTGGLANRPQLAFLAGSGPEAVLPSRLTSFLMNASTQPSSGPVSLILNINNPVIRSEADKNNLIRDVKREMVKFYDVLEKRDVRFTRQQVN